MPLIELRQRGVRPDHAHRRRSRTRSTRSGARSARSSARRTMYKYMNRFGFDRKPLIDLPARRDARERRLLTQTAELLGASRRDRHRPRRDRPGAPAGDAAADGDGGVGDRQRRQPDAPAPGREGHATATADGAQDQAERGEQGDEAERRRSALAAMMSQVVKEGTGTAAALAGHRRGRQDRDGGEGRREPGVVHRVRARCSARAWRSP